MIPWQKIKRKIKYKWFQWKCSYYGHEYIATASTTINGVTKPGSVCIKCGRSFHL